MLVKGTEISSFRIVSEESAPGRYAAKELEAYLTRMGLTVGGEFTFTLKIDADGIGNDSYRITVEDDGITICGGNGRGVVYGFLERYAGVRYFTPELETLGYPDFAVDEDYTYQSVFELRQQSWYNAFHNCHSHPYISEHCENGREMVRNVEGRCRMFICVPIWRRNALFPKKSGWTARSRSTLGGMRPSVWRETVWPVSGAPGSNGAL